MGLGDQQSEYNNWYENSEQRQIDKYLVDDWMKKVYEQHKELGIDFDQSYQDRANAAAARINAFEAYQKEQQQRLEQEAETQRLTQEFNAAVADVNEGLLRNGEEANRNAQQMAGEQQAREGLRKLAENLTQAAAEADQTPIPVLGATYSSTAVNLIIGGTDYGYVPAQVAYEQPVDSSSVSIPEKSAIGSVIDAFKKGEFRIGDYGIRIVDDTERQKALLRAKTAEFGSGMNFLLPWVGGGGLASIGSSARTIGRVGLAVEGSSKAVKTAEQLSRESVTVKLEKYLLNVEHVDGASKAKWFEKALGFTKENASDLARQIVFDPNKAVKTATTEFGTKYNQVIPVTGPNGKTINVVFAWIENNDGVIRLITAIPTKL